MAAPQPTARPAPKPTTLTTADAVPAEPLTAGAIVSPDDFFEEYTSETLKPAIVENVLVKGQPVYVARLTAAGLDTFYDEVKGEEIPGNEYRGAIMAFAIVREHGTRIFEPRHRTRLSDMPAGTTSEIVAKFFEINGLSRGK